MYYHNYKGNINGIRYLPFPNMNLYGIINQTYDFGYTYKYLKVK